MEMIPATFNGFPYPPQCNEDTDPADMRKMRLLFKQQVDQYCAQHFHETKNLESFFKNAYIEAQEEYNSILWSNPGSENKELHMEYKMKLNTIKWQANAVMEERADKHKSWLDDAKDAYIILLEAENDKLWSKYHIIEAERNVFLEAYQILCNHISELKRSGDRVPIENPVMNPWDQFEHLVDEEMSTPVIEEIKTPVVEEIAPERKSKKRSPKKK